MRHLKEDFSSLLENKCTYSNYFFRSLATVEKLCVETRVLVFIDSEFV